MSNMLQTDKSKLKQKTKQNKNPKKKERTCTFQSRCRWGHYLHVRIPAYFFAYPQIWWDTKACLWFFALFIVLFTYFSQPMISLRLVHFISVLIRKRFINFHSTRIFERLASWKTTTAKTKNKKNKFRTNFTLPCSFQKVIRTRWFK